MTPLFILIAAVVVFLACATIIIVAAGPVMLLQPRRRTAEYYRRLGQPAHPSEVGLHAEDVAVTTEGGTSLRGWFIPSATRAVHGTLLYLHGVGDCKIDGVRFAKVMHDNGFHVVIFDSRRHGESEGTFCTYGYYEKHDVSSILDSVLGRTETSFGKVGLFGTSMGAAIALQVAAIDNRVAAVVSENSFATLRTIFDDYQKRMIKLPFHYLRNLVIKRSEVIAHFKARDVSPLEAVAGIRIPLLFVYALNDEKINYRYSLQLYEAAHEPKELLPVENAGHADVWQTAGREYESRLVEFFLRHLR
jgi:pimeloyl-ACP methyl ester carboxylesterase